MTCFGVLLFLIKITFTVIFYHLLLCLRTAEGVPSIPVYCIEDRNDPSAGHPLPIPLPQDTFNSREDLMLLQETVTQQLKPRTDPPFSYYECPPRTKCCPKFLCCPDPDASEDDDEEDSFGSTTVSPAEKKARQELITFYVWRGSIVLCILISLLIIVCCFWSPCPLYNSCHVTYTHDDAGCADKMGQMPPFLGSVMPPEESPVGNVMVVNQTRIDADHDDQKYHEKKKMNNSAASATFV